MPAITFSSGIFFNPSDAEPLSQGKVYIGALDTDPTVLANRITVKVVNEDGTETNIAGAAQPLILNVAGMLNYPYAGGGMGSVATMKVTSQFSMAVYDSNDVLQYYFPRATVTDATFVGDVIIDGDTTINGDVTILGGTYINYQREAILEVEVIDGVLTLPVQEATYFIATVDEDAEILFEGAPSVLDGYGQTWMLTVYYESGNLFFGEPDYALERRTANTTTIQPGTKNKYVFSSCEPGLIFVETFKDIILVGP